MEIFELAQFDRGGIRVLHERGLGDLQDQITRSEAGVTYGLTDLACEIGVLEASRGQVHVNGEVPGSRNCSLPDTDLTACLAKDHTVDLHHMPRHFRLTQELGWQQEAPLGMVPADERLDAGDAPASDVHHRLIVDDELLGFEGVLELVTERSCGEITGTQFGAEHPPTALAAGLRRVHRRIRLSEQVVEPFAVRERGDADAHTDRDVARGERPGTFELPHDPLGDQRGSLERLLQHDPELVATESSDGVDLAQRVTKPPGDVDENLVSGLVAKRVVHRLETVEVQVQDRDRGSLPAGSSERMFQLLHEQRAVRQPGERVMEREILQLVPAQLQLVGHRVEGASHPRELVVSVHGDPMREVLAAEVGRRFLQGLQRDGDGPIQAPRQEASEDATEEQDRERRVELGAFVGPKRRDLFTHFVDIQRVLVRQECSRLVHPIVERIESLAAPARRTEQCLLQRIPGELPTETGRAGEEAFGSGTDLLDIDEAAIDLEADLDEREPFHGIVCLRVDLTRIVGLHQEPPHIVDPLRLPDGLRPELLEHVGRRAERDHPCSRDPDQREEHRCENQK